MCQEGFSPAIGGVFPFAPAIGGVCRLKTMGEYWMKNKWMEQAIKHVVHGKRAIVYSDMMGCRSF